MKAATRRTILLLLPVIFLYGCASVNKAPVEQDVAAKQFAVNPARAQLYIYRDQSFGSAISMPVAVDGTLIGTTGPKSFFKLDLEEGTYTITSQGDKSTLDVEIEPGNNYYVRQQVIVGLLVAGSKLRLVDEAKGQEGVSKSTLIQSSY